MASVIAPFVVPALQCFARGVWVGGGGGGAYGEQLNRLHSLPRNDGYRFVFTQERRFSRRQAGGERERHGVCVCVCAGQCRGSRGVAGRVQARVLVVVGARAACRVWIVGGR